MPNTMENVVSAFFEGKNAAKNTRQPLNPLDHLAFAILLDAGEDAETALGALNSLRQTFIDWNEIRVARTQEVARALKNIAAAEESAQRIRDEYNAFFDRKGSLDFDFLSDSKVAEGRKLLQQTLPKLRKPAIAFLLYEFVPGASLPLSDSGLKHARKLGMASKNADRSQFDRVLSEQFEKADICRLIQHIEIEIFGNPYGEAARNQAGSAKRKKPSAKKTGK